MLSSLIYVDNHSSPNMLIPPCVGEKYSLLQKCIFDGNKAGPPESLNIWKIMILASQNVQYIYKVTSSQWSTSKVFPCYDYNVISGLHDVKRCLHAGEPINRTFSKFHTALL